MTKRNPMHAICPYFAMFPESFPEKFISRFSSKNDLIFDPFSGRGTTLFQANLMGRKALACDTNPVAYCISASKANLPTLQEVVQRIKDLRKEYETLDYYQRKFIEDTIDDLPAFFDMAFHKQTLPMLIFLMNTLNWEKNQVDCFIMSIILGSLHGDMKSRNSYFSNQMPRTISTKPNYSIKYWKARNLVPEYRDVFKIIKAKSEYRLNCIKPQINSEVRLCDARVAGDVFSDYHSQVKLLITSPPYFNVTCFEEDQWLRLWMLGGNVHPKKGIYSSDDRHTSKKKYWNFLTECWQGILPLLDDECFFIIRIGARGMNDLEITIGLEASIQEAFSDVKFIKPPFISLIKGRQTRNILPNSIGCKYEIDYQFNIRK